jgi:hypothetical protein
MWNNRYIYNKKIVIDSFEYALLVDDSDASHMMVYGVALLNKNKTWDDLKKKSEELESIYKEYEEFKLVHIEL